MWLNRQPPMLQSLAHMAMLCYTREIYPPWLFLPPLQRCSQRSLIPWRTHAPLHRGPHGCIRCIAGEGAMLCGIIISDCLITRSLLTTHARDGKPRRMIPEIYVSSVLLSVTSGLTFRTWHGRTSIQDSWISLAVTTRSWTTSSAQRYGLTAAQQRLPSLMILVQYNRPEVDPRWHHILRRSSSLPMCSKLPNSRYRRIANASFANITTTGKPSRSLEQPGKITGDPLDWADSSGIHGEDTGNLVGNVDTIPTVGDEYSSKSMLSRPYGLPKSVKMCDYMEQLLQSLDPRGVVRLASASKHQLDVLGVTQLVVTVGSLVTRQPFVVVRNLGTNALLGCTFADKHIDTFRCWKRVVELYNGDVIPIVRRAAAPPNSPTIERCPHVPLWYKPGNSSELQRQHRCRHYRRRLSLSGQT